ncbi:MAG: peptidylprolyl isomerase [Flavobacteriaceae bacterium]
MAALGSLRRNSFVLISVIGMALFAFVIAGVFDGSGFQSQDPIGEVNGEKISITDFRNQVDFLKKSYNFSDLQALNTSWDQVTRKEIFRQRIDQLGLGSGKAHLDDFLTNNPNFNSDERFLDDAGIFDIDKFTDFVLNLKDFNPQGYSQWTLQEKEFKNQIDQNNYLNLLKSGINSSNYEGELEFLKSNLTANILYVKIPYSSIPDSLVTISNSEIKAYINKNSDDFEQKPTRDFEYVVFEELPSYKDERDLRDKLNSFLNDREEFNPVSNLNEFVMGFKSTNDFDFYIDENSDVAFDSLFRPKGFFSSDHAQMIFNLNNDQIYGPYKDNGFMKISRMLEKKNNGNVRASHILISYKGSQNADPSVERSKNEAKIEANRILALARLNPDSFSSLALDFSDGPSKSSGGDLGFFQEGMMVKPFNDYVFKNNIGRIGVVETEFGFHVIKVVAKEDLAKVATIALKNVPSNFTSDSVFNVTSKFEIELSKSKDLISTAESFDYESKSLSSITPLDHELPALGNQRNLVKWLFEDDTKIGDYKRFDLSSGGYVLAQLKDVRNDGLMDLNTGSILALPELRKNKKADMIIKENKKYNSLDDLSNEKGLEIVSVSAINQSSPVVAQAGFEPVIIGNAFGLEVGETSSFFPGEEGVYMIKLVNINKVEAPSTYISFENQLSNKRRSATESKILESFKSESKIIDNRTAYY